MSTILIAPDSFKESLSAHEVAIAIANSWKKTRPDDQLLIYPMADGGEGTMEAILTVQNGEEHKTKVTDPIGKPIFAHWGWLEKSKTAIIEMAQASGLHLVPKEKRNILTASTHGTGELIKAALDAGAKTIILTLGGSATNDAGAGMLTALGARFLDVNDNELPAGGAALAKLNRIELAGFDPRLKEVNFVVACDVDNPLCGAKGASAIFGPQKGATSANVIELDQALSHFAQQCSDTLGNDLQNRAGAGAAGGTGYAALAFLNAKLRPGVELVAELTQLKQALTHADLIITGEGQLDKQTLHGKTIKGIIELAAQRKTPVIALAGCLGEGYEELYQHGLTVAFSIASGPISLEASQQNAALLLAQRIEDIVRLYDLFK